jgi:lysylphosphatidylglycerol synthetase-like protein (DUF2156 family)
MTEEARNSVTTPLGIMIFQQNSENARHIKSERIWFMNIYAVITAGVLSLLHTAQGKNVLEVALLVFMSVFSLIGLLTSFRLKAELEECQQKFGEIAEAAGLVNFVALGKSEGALSRYPKFRWIFPIFYSIATSAFTALLIDRVVTGKTAW